MAFLRSISLGVLTALFLAGCTYAPDDPRSQGRGQPRANAVAPAPTPANAPTAADRRPPPIPEKDRVLYDYRAAAGAMRTANYDEAKTRLDDAIARIGGIIT